MAGELTITVNDQTVDVTFAALPGYEEYTLALDGFIEVSHGLFVGGTATWQKTELESGRHSIIGIQHRTSGNDSNPVGEEFEVEALNPASFAELRPTVQMVADLLRTRTVGEGGTSEDIFNEGTYPTAAQVERLIDQATNAIFTQLPGSVAEPWAPAGQHLAALYAAILIEASYFREQLTDDQVQLYRDLLISGIRGLGAAIGEGEMGAGSRMTVDSIVMRGIATVPPEYVWMLDIPPLPPELPEVVVP